MGNTKLRHAIVEKIVLSLGLALSQCQKRKHTCDANDVFHESALGGIVLIGKLPIVVVQFAQNRSGEVQPALVSKKRSS